MIAELRRQLAETNLLRDLRALAADAPDSAPVSLSLALPPAETTWLDALPANTPFWYMARPANKEFRLGIGQAFVLSSSGNHRFAALDNGFAGLTRNWRHNGEAWAFAGFAFDPQGQGPLPNALLAIPAILLECVDGQCRTILSCPAGRLSDALLNWQKLLASAPVNSPGQLLGDNISPRPTPTWISRVSAALDEIHVGRLQKVVLARSRKIGSTRPFLPAAVLDQLVRHQPDCLTYAYHNGQQTFLGATPEQLVRRRNGRCTADALAGTAWQGSPDLADEKNRHEQALVVAAIVDALSPFCLAPPNVGQTRERPAGHLRHLHTEISGTISDEVSLFNLLEALHPTPAVGGFPRNAARDWLNAIGEQRQAWYSGGFGLLHANGDGEFSVALRSALLDGRSAELHAGAGIVAGSDAQTEFAETDAKMDTLRHALQGASDQHTDASRYA